MTVFKKTMVGMTSAVLLLVGVTVVVVALLPGVVSQLGYALEVGQAEAAQERLAVANELATVFGDVAEAVGPSVVSVSSTK